MIRDIVNRVCTLVAFFIATARAQGAVQINIKHILNYQLCVKVDSHLIKEH